MRLWSEAAARACRMVFDHTNHGVFVTMLPAE